MHTYNRHRGLSLVEAVISISLFLTVLLGLLGGFSVAIRQSSENISKVKAMFLAEEGLEVAKLLRDESWMGNIQTKTSEVPYYLHFNGTSWVATTTNASIDGVFERSIVFSDVYRDSLNNIVSSGGSIDNKTKKVTAQVSWNSRNGTVTKTLSTYVADIFNN